jgi:predicted nucleic acid-binding protein
VTTKLVADAGPLIALAKTGHLEVLKRLFTQVTVPPAVRDELGLDSGKPGAAVLAQAVGRGGWIEVKLSRSARPALRVALGDGEAEAIALAASCGALLLIDERKGRNAAMAAGVKVVGTGRILVAAKEKGYLQSVSAALTQMASIGYRLSEALVRRIKELAGET